MLYFSNLSSGASWTHAVLVQTIFFQSFLVQARHMLSWSRPYFSNLFWYKLGICCLGPYCIFKICFLVQARHTLSWSILYFWNLLLVQVRHTLSWSILYFWNLLLVQARHMPFWSILYFLKSVVWYKLGICVLGPYCTFFQICFLVQAGHKLSLISDWLMLCLPGVSQIT